MTTTIKTPQQLLREAAELIDLALARLDIRSTPCVSCGSNRFVNFAQAKTYLAFENTSSKLRDAANRLDEKHAHAPQGAIE